MSTPFADQVAAARFGAAYDQVLSRWPVPVTSVDVESVFGSTRVQICGPEDAPPILLLPGAGATAMVWFATVGELSQDHRVHAVDLIGDAGRSRSDGRPILDREDLMAWLDRVLDELGLLGAALVGHAYGGWIALSYALHAPHRVRALALLDPTRCFAGLSPGYLLLAGPWPWRATARRQRALLRYETGGTDLDPDWLELALRAATDFRRIRPVVGPRPEPERLGACTVPTLVILAERSRVHPLSAVAAEVHRLMPRAVVRVVPGVSHHQLPFGNPGELSQQLLRFFRSARPGRF